MSVEQIQDRVEIFDFGEGSYTDIKLVFLTPKNYLGQQCLVGGAKTFLFRSSAGNVNYGRILVNKEVFINKNDRMVLKLKSRNIF